MPQFPYRFPILGANEILRKLPKVTYNLSEYLRLTGRDEIEVSRYATALYFDGVIWLSRPSAKLLLHETVHHIIGNSSDVSYVAPRLLGDLLNVFWDVFYFRASHFRTTVEQRRECIARIKEALNDFLDWVLCR